MANFKTHQLGAFSVGVVSAVGSKLIGMTNIEQSLLVCAVGYFGGLAPDLDHDSSIPLKHVFQTMALLIPTVLIHKHPELQTSLLFGCLVFMTIAVTIYFPFRWLFNALTTHRGIFHSVPAIIIFGEIFFLITGRRTDDLPYQQAMGIAASAGYFTHLLLDEYSSLNFSGSRFQPKRSLGTALDFFKPNKIVTCVAYSLLGILSFLVWLQL